MDALLTETRGPALWLTLNRPSAQNALNREVMQGLLAGLEMATRQPEIRVLVLTGSGERAFCAGADLKDSRGSIFDDSQAHAGSRPENPLIAVFRAMRNCSKPIIARVNGAAVGGGLGLVAGCDLAYAANDARFGTPEAKVGLFPMMISTYLLRQIPRRVFTALAFTGDLLDAASAQRYNLINLAVEREKLDETIEAVIQKILLCSPNALRAGKQFIDTIQDLPLDQALERSDTAIAELSASDEAREGIAAFAQKRAPRWSFPKVNPVRGNS